MFSRKRWSSSPQANTILSHEDKITWLMEEYGEMVIRLAFTYVKQKELAEDIAQEVFIKCYEKIETFQGQSSYKTWLYRITVNKCKDVLKSWSFRNFFPSELIELKLKGTHQSFDKNLIEYEEKQFISSIVLDLPLKLREVIILHYYEELTITEIADLLNQNSNTIKTRLYRARNAIKRVLEGEDEKWKTN
ncbi:sigma-70 family RNA polymerase sigma factor [Heyndrickxia sp. NPDC080065]|uniref:sigma-70 family RNA polymerase sigma factor n=1 Tax=Heyndrickxia sp. NPDC080065 TaxID=3390568 RepID=UPI003D08B754